MNKSLIESTVVIPELAATERDPALDEVLGAVVDAGLLDAGGRAKVLRQLRKREEQGSTGLGNGVAVPHVKEAAVAEIVVAVAVSHLGIGFDAIDGRPVHIMFVVLGPKKGQPEDHLAVLRWVSTLARNADFRRFAQQVKSVEELQDLLLEMTGSA
jgi:mannitol/fructose-specific phosphotransferase system IIA component (Ntr-type)